MLSEEFQKYYDLTNLGIASTILGINYKNFKINKEILNNQNDNNFEKKIIELLESILKEQKEIKTLLKK